MRILRIIYDWPRPWTGLSPAPYELTKAQVNAGHQIDVFCGVWPFSGGIARTKGVTFHPFLRAPLPATVFLTTAPFMFLYYLEWRKNNPVDIIHAHGQFGIWLYFYRSLLKRFFKKSKELKTPMVVHFHITAVGRTAQFKKEEKQVKFYSKYFEWPLHEWSDKLAASCGDAFIFVSSAVMTEAIEHYGIDKSKCFVVETGVNTELFIPVSSEEREKTRRDMSFDRDDKVILNLGMQTERKNVHLLIEALPFLPPHYKLILVGPCSSEYAIRLETLITQFNVRNRVIRAAATPYPQVPIAYQMADVFVLPSSFEGMPKVVFEALSCEVPVLGHGFKAREEISGLVYLPSLEPKIIADEIKRIVETAVYVDRPKVINYYSWGVKAREVEEVYKRVLV